jgi:hypothetical protein
MDYETQQIIVSKASSDGRFAIAAALLEIAEAHHSLATHLKYLGVGNAATEMGAAEFLAGSIKGGLLELASAIDRNTPLR